MRLEVPVLSSDGAPNGDLRTSEVKFVEFIGEGKAVVIYPDGKLSVVLVDYLTVLEIPPELK